MFILLSGDKNFLVGFGNYFKHFVLKHIFQNRLMETDLIETENNKLIKIE